MDCCVRPQVRLDVTAACFVAGTLVHTREGLVPIEQIKIGDWVLSQPENKGERSYRRVTETFVYEDREIYLFAIGRTDEGHSEDGAEDTICVTAEHPIWRSDISCWDPAEDFGLFCRVELHDGSEMDVLGSSKIYRRVRFEDGIGYALDYGSDELYKRIDFRRDWPRVSPEGQHYWLHGEYRNGEWVALDDHPDDEEYPRYRTRVYNFTVEEFHTYYVGRLGIWVHNTSGGNVGPGPLSIGNPDTANVETVPQPISEAWKRAPSIDPHMHRILIQAMNFERQLQREIKHRLHGLVRGKKNKHHFPMHNRTLPFAKRPLSRLT